MVYCSHCAKNVAGERLDDGFLCCGSCGRVLEDYFFAEEPTFVKNAAGQSKLSGNYVRTVQSEFSESRQRTLDRAYDEIKYLSMGLGVHDEHMADQALTFYKIALERNFTRGRKSEQVQAACLYIAFRHNNKPYLLIDFSIFLRIDVYVLGSVFLQLCEVLRLGEHPIVQKPVDPSLFIHRYTKNLIKRGSKAVSDTALTIVASMKRDWMQTGRKPSGLCGAAIYISALAHGIKCSKPDILRIVHVCEATLTKRLVEFENTECSSLTVEELDTMAKEHEKNPTVMAEGELRGCISKDLLCEHKDSGASHFALGLCEECYKEFDKLSGGLGGGLDPPAFQRAERERMKRALLEESVDEACDLANASNDQFKNHAEDFPACVPEGMGLMLPMRPLKMVNMNMMIHLEKMNQKLYLILMIKTLIYTFMMRRGDISRRYYGKQQIGSILRSRQPRKQLQQLIRKLLRQILRTVQRIYLQQESLLHLLLRQLQNPERK
ncbi:hypothetical protein PHAVU_001G106433 [Phaseolus vulgaris]